MKWLEKLFRKWDPEGWAETDRIVQKHSRSQIISEAELIFYDELTRVLKEHVTKGDYAAVSKLREWTR